MVWPVAVNLAALARGVPRILCIITSFWKPSPRVCRDHCGRSDYRNDLPHIEIRPNWATKQETKLSYPEMWSVDISIHTDGRLPIETLDRARKHDYDVSKEHQECVPW